MDASAAGADEIGKAMQKAGATATEAGLSFEWLGAYIATISERTRQAPEVIGTSLNSIMSRLQSIKQKGYNEDDETQINDIAKALRNIDVAIMDNEGNWRAMSDIFMDIAMQWENLDDKTRSYIATTMAGTRQKNYFLSLMDDMKNVTSTTGEVSRAMELYQGALDSTGAAAEKYAIWQDSVTAAQDRMKASLDQLYSLFNSDVLKGFYSLIGDAADGIYSIFSDDTSDYTSVIAHFQDQATWIQNLRDEYVQLDGIKNRTKEQDERMVKILGQLVSGNRNLATEIKTAEGGYVDAETAIKAMNTELERNLDLFRQYSQFSLKDIISDTKSLGSALQDWEDAMKKPDFYRIFSIVSQENGIDIREIKNKDAKRLVGDINSIIDQYDINQVPLDWQKKIYEYFYPDGKRNEEVFSAWNLFLSDFKNNLVAGIHSLEISTADAAATKVENELAKKTSYVIENILYGKDFASLPEKIKSNVYNLTKEIIAGIDEADWYQGEQHLTDLIITETQKRVNDYVNMMSQARDFFATTGLYKEEDINAAWGENWNQLQDLQNTIDAYNQLHGTTYTLASVMNAAVDPANEFGDAIKKDGEKAKVTMIQLEELWESVSAGAKKWRISQKSDNNWMSELEQMKNHLENTNLDRIIYAMENMDTDYRDAMREDFEWLDQFLELVSKGNREGALSFLNEQMANLDEKSVSLRESLKGVREELEADAAKKENFITQLSELTKYLPSSELQGGEIDTASITKYISSLSESMQEALFTFSPKLKESLALLNSDDLADQAEGAKMFEEAILLMASAWDTYAESYLAAQELEVDDEKGRSLMNSLNDAYNTDGIEGYREAFAKMTDEEKAWIESNSKAHKDFVKAWAKGEDGIEDSTKAMKKFNREAKKLDLDKLAESGEIWQEVADIADESVDTEQELYDAYNEVKDKLVEVVEAQSDLNFVMNSSDKTSDEYTDALNNIKNLCGITSDSEEDLAQAQQYLANQMDLATMSSGELLNYLMTMTGITFNSATWQSELAALAASGDAAAICMQNLIAYLSSINGTRINYANGLFSVSGLGSAALKRSGGTRRSSGGGGSGSSSNEMSEIEKMLDLMEQIQDIRKHQMDMISAQRDYYQESGYLSMVIKSYESERNAVEENSKVLEDNIKKIESLLSAKQQEVAAMSTSDKKYEQAAEDLKSLQEAHQNYSKELLENRTAIEEFNNAIKDMQNEIRDMEIDIRNTILEAIEDREELNERMLQGRIDVENEILDVIKARYEKERDLAIKTAESKIEALEAESEALDKQLQKRKEIAEQEDKQLKLAQLQAKLERISADPTRRKEELELRKEIQELRDEMAWDLAEQEVEAQQESIDQQIESLEDYIEQVEDYYEDLFEHPQKLLEELKSIMMKTDDEILDFLKQNNEDYANSTEAMQQDMINGWNEMLMDMHGSIKTYWDEVEQIIAGGDDAIIEFLKQNSADYKTAGKLQAEAYVDQWKQQLEDLHNAYKVFVDEVNNTKYNVVLPSTGSSGSGGSGSAGSQAPSQTIYKYRYKTKNGTWSVNYGGTSQVDAFNSAKTDALSHWNKYKSEYGVSEVIRLLNASTVSNPGAYIKQFATGGLANFTGPAWLDGTPSAPERILSPYQTELFEDMIKTLHSIKVNAVSMPKISYDQTGSTSAFTFGDIIINVDKLDSDADYEYIAERVKEQMMDSVGRGASVGGIRVMR